MAFNLLNSIRRMRTPDLINKLLPTFSERFTKTTLPIIDIYCSALVIVNTFTLNCF